jgi:hypothetical protein
MMAALKRLETAIITTKHHSTKASQKQTAAMDDR